MCKSMIRVFHRPIQGRWHNKSVESTAARHVAGTGCGARTVAAVAHLCR